MYHIMWFNVSASFFFGSYNYIFFFPRRINIYIIYEYTCILCIVSCDSTCLLFFFLAIQIYLFLPACYVSYRVWFNVSSFFRKLIYYNSLFATPRTPPATTTVSFCVFPWRSYSHVYIFFDVIRCVFDLCKLLYYNALRCRKSITIHFLQVVTDYLYHSEDLIHFLYFTSFK